MGLQQKKLLPSGRTVDAKMKHVTLVRSYTGITIIAVAPNLRRVESATEDGCATYATKPLGLLGMIPTDSRA
jgi:hypothetical protein